ncbi:MAG: EmrB/QacA family drug resistance transporter, partial [Ktedonobacterales bacterium]
GVATSGVTFFRSIGASFGVAAFGAIFANALSANLRALSPAGVNGVGGGTSGESPQALQHLPPSVRAAYVHAYAVSLQPVFRIAAVIGVIAFVLTWFLDEVPLRATTGATDLGEAHAMPEARSSRDEIERALDVLVSRDSQQRVFQRLAIQAGLSLTPGACWLLCCLRGTGSSAMQQLSGQLQLTEGILVRPLVELTQAGLVTRAPDPRQDGASATSQSELIMLTPAGREVSGRLITVRREELTRLLDGWSPEQEAELATLLTDMAQRLVTEGADGRVLVSAQTVIDSGAGR